ncbi:ring-cleaving dioxygenase [Alkalihalobacillus sp. MEB130]|uniref:ring-cleaving dioxygenase n=1 Tax=Alkalihalobacillus sp. MEB130 TaxID=2976704 RepID=UPI0028DEA8B9|nr:ring-cleaving dioxygenase [Alkalihalobacillus sp. MEB130]MDT8862351.1 ring-cleaving dioxygenase [Alkalihalobacillus sp. MEB130]
MKFTKIELFTNKLKEMKGFYKDVLELHIISENTNDFSVKIGSTSLIFKQSQTDSEPFYHFAINIPENKMEEAKSWIQSKLDLNIEKESDEVFFKSWNAHAIYFEDPSGNILEFIARHNLKNAVEHRFSSDDFINISEIGIVVDEVIPFVRKLNELGIPNWRDDSEGLTPVGDENGLFITVKDGRRWFFSKKDAEFYPFEVTIEEIGACSFNKQGNKVSIN